MQPKRALRFLRIVVRVPGVGDVDGPLRELAISAAAKMRPKKAVRFLSAFVAWSDDARKERREQVSAKVALLLERMQAKMMRSEADSKGEGTRSVRQPRRPRPPGAKG